MKKIIVLAAALSAFVLGCAKKDTGAVYLLNFKPEIDQQWKEVAAQFTAETGIKMKVVTAASGTYESTLRAELSKSGAPTLFNINGPVGYQTWKDWTADLKDTQIYSWLTDKSLAVTANGGVYGIPYAVETYGIIYNDAVLRKYFALPNKAAGVSSMGEVTSFEKLKALVEDIQKNKAALGIDGAFASTSFAPGEDWRWQTHLANLPIYYEYSGKGVGDLPKIDFSYNANYKNIFDLYTNNSLTEKKMLGSKTVGDSMSEFALGKAAFVQNGNWAWGQINSEAGNIVNAADIKFLPIYTGVTGEEAQGLCTGTENFISLNSQAGEKEKENSLALLEWLFNTPQGKQNVIEKLGFVAPFSTFSVDERPSDPLVREMFRYLDNANLKSVSWNFVSFPGQAFKDNLGAALYQYAIGDKSWDDLVTETKANWEADKTAIAN